MLRLALIVSVLAACQTKQDPPKADPPKADPPKAEPQGKADPPMDKPRPAVDLAAFAKDCKEATDCVLVKRNACDACACAVDAIASKEVAKFDEAANKLECGEPDLDRIMACGGCAQNKAGCSNGQCVIAEAAAQ